MQRHVERIAMVEAHPVMKPRLAEGADGQSPAEPRLEEPLELGRIARQRPLREAAEADETWCLLIGSLRERPLPAHIDHERLACHAASATARRISSTSFWAAISARRPS